MSAILSFLKYTQHQNCDYIKWAESHKGQFSENQISISVFIKEIG